MHETIGKHAFFKRKVKNEHGDKIYPEETCFFRKKGKKFQEGSNFPEMHGSVAKIQGSTEWWCFREVSNDNLLLLPDEADYQRCAPRSQQQADEACIGKMSGAFSRAESTVSNNSRKKYRRDVFYNGSSIRGLENNQSINGPPLFISEQNNRKCSPKEVVLAGRKKSAKGLLWKRSLKNSMKLSSRALPHMPKWTKILSNVHLKQSISENCKMDVGGNKNWNKKTACECKLASTRCQKSRFSLKQCAKNPYGKCTERRKKFRTRDRRKNIPEKQGPETVERIESKQKAHSDCSWSTKIRNYLPFIYRNRIRKHLRSSTFHKNKILLLNTQNRDLILERENDMRETEFFCTRSPYNLDEATEIVQATSEKLPNQDKFNRLWDSIGYSKWCSKPQRTHANPEALGNYDGLRSRSSLGLQSLPDFCTRVSERFFTQSKSKTAAHLSKKDEAEIRVKSIFEESSENDNENVIKIDPLKAHGTLPTEQSIFINFNLEDGTDECKKKKTKIFDYGNLANQRSDKIIFAKGGSLTGEFSEGYHGVHVLQKVEELEYIQRRITDRRAPVNKESSHNIKSEELQRLRVLQRDEELENVKPREADRTRIRKIALAEENSDCLEEEIIVKEIDLARTFRNNHQKGEHTHSALGNYARFIADVDEVVKDRCHCGDMRNSARLVDTGVELERLNERRKIKRNELQTDCIFVRGYIWRWQRRVTDIEKRRVIREYSLNRAYWSAQQFEICDISITWQRSPLRENEFIRRGRVATLHLYTRGRYDPYLHRLRLLIIDELGKGEISICNPDVENVSYSRTNQQLNLLIFKMQLPVDFPIGTPLIRVECKCDSRTESICLIYFSTE